MPLIGCQTRNLWPPTTRVHADYRSGRFCLLLRLIVKNYHYLRDSNAQIETAGIVSPRFAKVRHDALVTPKL